MHLKHIIDSNDNNTLEVSEDLAIMGSAPRLADNPMGQTIDQHEYIIRCNAAPLIPHVSGYRTSIRFVNDSNYDKFVNMDSKINVVGFGKCAYHPPRREAWLPKDNVYSFDHFKGDSIWANKVLESIGLETRFNEEIMKFVHQADWPPDGCPYRVHPRMGLRAILIAVDSGIKPTLYGFDDVMDEKYAHFWGGGHSHGLGWEEINAQGHEIEAEMKIIRELREKDLVTWV